MSQPIPNGPPRFAPASREGVETLARRACDLWEAISQIQLSAAASDRALEALNDASQSAARAADELDSLLASGAFKVG
jgi:ABC-type transporter Mla subunit MlaD